MDEQETLADRGEAGLIRAMVARLPAPPPGAIAIGDDAALIPWTGQGLLGSVDLLVEGVHFRRSTTSARDLGWKALAVNLSDLAAMGAEPVCALVGLAAPADLAASWVEDLYDGLAEHGVYVAGGDTTGSPGPVMISVTVLGRPGPAGRVLTRDAARPGDVLFVTGLPGRAAAGLACLEDPSLDPPDREALIQAHRRPVPQVAIGRAIAASGVRCALMDDSDGLGRSAQLLAAASGVRIVLHEGHELHGGEDYHLVGTCAPADYAALDLPGQIVGRVEAGAGAWVQRGPGSPEALAGEMGYAHFARTSFPPR